MFVSSGLTLSLPLTSLTVTFITIIWGGKADVNSEPVYLICFPNGMIISFFLTDNRTYHLMAEDEVEADAWMSVLLNSKDGRLITEY